MFSRSANLSNRYFDEHDEDWIEPKKPRRDTKKFFLVLGLGTLSWVATYVGMLELIQANMGSLDLGTKLIVGFSVAMLMTMIIWLLDQMFAPHPFGVKLAYVVGYIFLSMISVGFGFGFYWKVLESRSEASRSAESAVGQVQASLLAGAARLDQLQGTLEQLTVISREKAILERDKGTSCPNSRPGDGPRRRLRDDDAARFEFASNFVKGRSTQVKGDMRGLDDDLKKIVNSDPSTFDSATGTRNKFLQGLSRKLELTATSFNAFRTDPQLRQIRSELAERANRSTFPTGSGNATFSCPDGQLQSALFGVVKAIDQLPELGKPEIATVEGAQAVVEAFRRLTTTGQGLLAFKLPPSADELRALQTQAVRSVSPGAAARRSDASGGLSQGGLSQRDYIPLAIALFVDLCLLLVSIGRPMNRLGGLVPKMREAERGPVYQILSKFDDIHRDPKIREKFEVFRHVVFDFNGDYYVAVPLDAPRNRNPEEVKNLQLEAHLLANLFASFEKEKIFARVYNPLLSRKTIQKKLWSQGSKFAASQAFRTYRFKDGAWSDIILGAVMGAARRAQSDRRRAADEAGPNLQMPKSGTSNPSEDRAREIVAETIGDQSADAKEQLRQPFTADSEDDDAATMAAAFGPYADKAVDASAYSERVGIKSWPYQKPQAEPSEADVDLMPANSNTSPSRGQLGERLAVGDGDMPAEAGSDNVILMPLPTAQDAAMQPPPRAQGRMQGRAFEAPAFNMKSPHVPEAPEIFGIAQDDVPLEQSPEAAAMATPPPLPQTRLMPEPPIETSMNVRITQRTADFQIPITASSSGRPVEFIRTGMKTALMSSADFETDKDQLALDLDAEQAPEAVDEPVFLLQAPEDGMEFEEVNFTSAKAIDLSDDDLEEISRRFAPNARV